MLKHLFSLRRRQAPRNPTPVRRRPDPMPRMRWYS
jgi:hypothetical protein